MATHIMLAPLLSDLERFAGFLRRHSEEFAVEDGPFASGFPSENASQRFLPKLMEHSARPVLASLDAAAPLIPGLPEGGRRARAERLWLAARDALAWGLAASGRCAEAREALARKGGIPLTGRLELAEAVMIAWMLDRAVLAKDYREAAVLYSLLKDPFFTAIGPKGPGGLKGSDGLDVPGGLEWAAGLEGPGGFSVPDHPQDPGGGQGPRPDGEEIVLQGPEGKLAPNPDEGAGSAGAGLSGVAPSMVSGTQVLTLAKLRARVGFNMCLAALAGARDIEPEPYLADVSRSLLGILGLMRDLDPEAALPVPDLGIEGRFRPGAALAPGDPLRAIRGLPKDGLPLTSARTAAALAKAARLEAGAFVATARTLVAQAALPRLREAFLAVAGPRPGLPAWPDTGTAAGKAGAASRLREAEFARYAVDILSEGGRFVSEAELYLERFTGKAVPGLAARHAAALGSLIVARAAVRDLLGAESHLERLSPLRGRGPTEAKARALQALVQAALLAGSPDAALRHFSELEALPADAGSPRPLDFYVGLLGASLSKPGNGDLAARVFRLIERYEPRDDADRAARNRGGLLYVRRLSAEGRPDEALNTFRSAGSPSGPEASGLWARAAMAILDAFAKAGRRPEALDLAFELERKAVANPFLKSFQDEISARVSAARVLQ